MTETHAIGITGAAGYIGATVASRLLGRGHDIVAVDTFQNPQVEDIDGLPIKAVDIRDRAAVRDVFAGVDVVLHLAAISGVPDCAEQPETAFDVNVGGTANVAWCCREQEVPLVFAGSMAILGDPVEFPIAPDHPRRPVNLYGRTKQMSEDDVHALAADAFPALVLMKSNIYGHTIVDGTRVSKDTVVNKFVDQARDDRPMTVYTPGSQARDFIHISDVARAYELAVDTVLDAPPGAQTITLGSGQCVSIHDLAETIQRIGTEELDHRPEITVVENPREHETIAEDFTVDTTTAHDVLGFEAELTIEDAIREMLRDASG